MNNPGGTLPHQPDDPTPRRRPRRTRTRSGRIAHLQPVDDATALIPAANPFRVAVVLARLDPGTVAAACDTDLDTVAAWTDAWQHPGPITPPAAAIDTLADLAGHDPDWFYVYDDTAWAALDLDDTDQPERDHGDHANDTTVDGPGPHQPPLF